MIRVLRTIRTVILVTTALVVLAAVGLFGWWTAIRPRLPQQLGKSLRPLHRRRLPRPDRRPRCPLHRRRPLNSLGASGRSTAERALTWGGAQYVLFELD
jgi:hypothetical protein